MINIKLTSTFESTDPHLLAQPKAFVLNIAAEGVLIPKVNHVAGVYQLQLRKDETVQIEDAVFQNLVNTSRGGGLSSNFLNQLLSLVARGVVEVRQNASLLTPVQILAFTA